MNPDILQQAEALLGKAVKVEGNRDWGIFWCPFHNDSARAGQGGHANFGVHLEKGYWACLRCGAKGGSLKSLSKTGSGLAACSGHRRAPGGGSPPVPHNLP